MNNNERFAASQTLDGGYRLLIEAVTDHAIYMLDKNGNITSWNPGAQRFKGYSEEEVIGTHFSRFYTEEDRADGLPERALDQAATTGIFEQEGWRVRKDGSRFWAHVVIDPIRDQAGNLVGFAKITRDLTERRAAEHELKTALEQFKRLVDGVTDYAIYMLDPTGLVVSWNAGAQRIKGYSADEIIGQHFSRFYAEEDRAHDEPSRTLSIASQEGRFETEALRVRKDGTRFWANVVVDAIFDESGAVIGFAKVTRDITEKRAAQLALEQARDALFQTLKMDAIGQLTGSVAHDFNNLLMAVGSSLELLGRRLPDDPKIRSLLDIAIRGVQRGTSLTQRMLAFARRQELVVGPIDVLNLVRNMSGLLERSLGPSIRVETRFPLRLGMALADANQLELAILNLSINARDAMPRGGTLLITGREEKVASGHATQLRPGPYVCVSVIDQGEGMDEATLARATDPFFTTKGVGKGTGLGLAMVHGLAEQFSGRLILRSRKGEGTTAELWLPLADSATPAVPDIVVPDAHAAGHEDRTLRVLVVDDDSLVLANAAAMLEELGHKVMTASSAREGLKILGREKGVDLVITDHAMPSMTGAQLAEQIQAKWPGLPIIVASGFAEIPVGSYPTLRRLSKPFSLEDLADAVHLATPRTPPVVQ